MKTIQKFWILWAKIDDWHLALALAYLLTLGLSLWFAHETVYWRREAKRLYFQHVTAPGHYETNHIHSVGPRPTK